VSKETDADMPTTIMKLNQTQTAYQAALQSAASIMKISLLDYIH
jgi:flagellar hook-associated protein 3 FlgL